MKEIPDFQRKLREVHAAERKAREAQERGNEAESLWDEAHRLRLKYGIVEHPPAGDYDDD
jgi:hypothetical protein